MRYVATEQPWVALGVPEVIALLGGAPTRWWLSGGCALDEFLGSASRPHGDIDVTVARGDWPALHAAVRPVLEVWIAHEGHLRSTDTTAVHPGAHHLWARPRGGGPWRLQINLEDITEQFWSYRREPRVTRPIADASWWSGRLWCIAPAVQLLWKAGAPLDKDEHDYAVTLPRLPAGERTWLGRAVRVAHPDSPWATRPELAGP